MLLKFLKSDKITAEIENFYEQSLSELKNNKTSPVCRKNNGSEFSVTNSTESNHVFLNILLQVRR